MLTFDYARPSTVAEAIGILHGQDGCAVGRFQGSFTGRHFRENVIRSTGCDTGGLQESLLINCHDCPLFIAFAPSDVRISLDPGR